MDRDTRMGGEEERFPLTRGSIVEGVRGDDPQARQRAWDHLIAAYWKPIYKHIRMKWGASNEEAKDLTQGFFVEAMERPMVEAYSDQKAGFRTYLRMCADGYVANQRRAAGRIKRGGDRRFVSLDFDAADVELSHAGPTASNEDVFFDQECARSLLERAIEWLRVDCEKSDRRTQFALFERYDLHSGNGPRPTYEKLAAEFDLPVTQVTNFLASSRRRLRRYVLEVLRELTVDEEEFRAEARRLLGTTA